LKYQDESHGLYMAFAHINSTPLQSRSHRPGEWVNQDYQFQKDAPRAAGSGVKPDTPA
jgi:hypothetical protein